MAEAYLNDKTKRGKFRLELNIWEVRTYNLFVEQPEMELPIPKDDAVDTLVTYQKRSYLNTLIGLLAARDITVHVNE